MYCPVYGCNSGSKSNNKENTPLRFFSFPSDKSKQEKRRRNAWINFCKRKSFEPTPATRICSRHFSDDAFIPSHSPTFLSAIGYTGKVKCLLKDDAIPTENKPETLTGSAPPEPKKRSAGKLSKLKVLYGVPTVRLYDYFTVIVELILHSC